MTCTDSFYVVVVVGLRHKEFIRLDGKVTKAGLPVALIYGGHISEGSNAGCNATAATATADLVLWQPNGARHFAGGVIPTLTARRVYGVSSAFDTLSEWLISKNRQSAKDLRRPAARKRTKTRPAKKAKQRKTS